MKTSWNSLSLPLSLSRQELWRTYAWQYLLFWSSGKDGPNFNLSTVTMIPDSKTRMSWFQKAKGYPHKSTQIWAILDLSILWLVPYHQSVCPQNGWLVGSKIQGTWFGKFTNLYANAPYLGVLWGLHHYTNLQHHLIKQLCIPCTLEWQKADVAKSESSLCPN